ncbi:ABC transporter ATP-binding protein [Sulfurimonas sp. HSL1-2]|uniref:ABC transporter ATP-binding protein n=1 Tax=Thiomicrolovo zhangzhouensis TaxID=3131933 RepID=UPI0031F79D44
MKITFGSLFQSLHAQRRDFERANAAGILATLLFLPIPILIPLLIDEILLHHQGRLTETLARVGITQTWCLIAVTLAAVLFLRVSVFFLNNLKTYYAMKITQKSAFMIRHSLLHHLERISLSEYEAVKSGTIVMKTIRDVEQISAFLGQLASTGLTSLLMFIGILGVMFTISWQLTLLLMVLNPIFFGISKILGRRAGALVRRQHEAYEEYHDMFSEILELFVQVRASNQERNFFGLLKGKAEKIQDASMDYGYRSSVATNSSSLLTNTVIDLFKALGIAAVIYSDLSIGMMLAFLFYLAPIAAPVQQLMALVISFQSLKPSMERVNHLLSMHREPYHPHTKNPFEGVSTVTVSLDDVTFGFDGKAPVLNSISLHAERGQKIALIGPSGSGKSTIAKLLVGFYQADAGAITYDGVPIEEIGLPVVREHVALMLQDSLFFNDTIWMNLTLGRPLDASDIFDALRAAQLESFIDSLDSGLDTLIGKNGIRLSGGQRQRLAIARLILSDPQVVIFDEATSALDNDTEERLYETLRDFLSTRTTIIIAHRPTTIRQADHIYYIEQGRVKGAGTFMELIEQGMVGRRREDRQPRTEKNQ